MFHRQDMHATLLKTATQKEGQGSACKVFIDHMCKSIDYEAGKITFENRKTVQVDLIIGADGIRVCFALCYCHRTGGANRLQSVVRSQLGILPDIKSANQTCYRCNVKTSEIERLGLANYAPEPAM